MSIVASTVRLILLTLSLHFCVEIRWGFADDVVLLRDENGSKQSVSLLDLTMSELHCSTESNAMQRLAWEKLKSLTFPRLIKSAVNAKTLVVLVNDDLLFVDHLVTQGETFVVQYLDQQLTIPFELVRRVAWQTDVFSAREPHSAPQGNDILILANGDVVPGELLSITDSEVTMVTELGSLQLPINSVRHLSLNSLLAENRDPKFPRFQFYFVDGSVCTVNQFESLGPQKKLMLHLTDSLQIQFPLQNLSRLEIWKQQHVQLSQIPVVRSIGENFWGTPQPFRINRNVNEQFLMTGDRLDLTGFGVRSLSGLTFSIPEQGESLNLSVGFDRRSGKQGAVVLQIVLDGKLAWEHTRAQPGSSSLDVPQISVKGHKEVELKVDFGARADVDDVINWCQPYFLLQPIHMANPID